MTGTEDHVPMAREIDDKKKRKALRKLRKAAERAAAEGGPGLSDWEKEFVDEVEARVEKYGSAFADPDKGNLDEPLSALQARKLKEIDKKSRGKGGDFKQRSGFKSSFKSKGKKPFTPRGRDIHDDLEEAPTSLDQPIKETKPPIPPRGSKPKLIKASTLLEKSMPDAAKPTPAVEPKQSKPSTTRKTSIFQVIKGGKDT